MPFFRRSAGSIWLTLAFCMAAGIAAAPGAKAAGYDGSYKGAGSTKSGGQCQDFVSTLKVQGGSFSMHYTGDLTITGTVTPGGALSGEGSASSRGGMRIARLAGQISGAIATLTTDTQVCHFDWKLIKAE